MIVFVDIVRFLRIAFDLKADFMVGVFQLGCWDQVVPLNVGQVIHSFSFCPFSLGLPVDVPQSQAHHAQQHQKCHKPHGQRNRCPLEAVLELSRGHGRGDSIEELTTRSGEA